MAFFKFRQGGDNPTPSIRPAESIETLRQRARNRLIGSVVLVLTGVVGFPLVFETQPRPMPVDVNIEIPDKTKVAPLQIPVPSVEVVVPETVVHPSVVSRTGKSVVSSAVPTLALPVPASPPPRAVTKPADTKVSAGASLDSEEQLVVSEAVKNTAKVQAPQALHVTAAISNEAKLEDSARAKSLLDGKTPAKPKDVQDTKDDGSGRYIIQVGAFADTTKAQEVRIKLEHAGLKTYTHVAETKDGPRTRVRLGPFASKAEAEKAAGKVKALALPAAILTL